VFTSAYLDFSLSTFANLGTFNFQYFHPLPFPGCFWFSSLTSCQF